MFLTTQLVLNFWDGILELEPSQGAVGPMTSFVAAREQSH